MIEEIIKRLENSSDTLKVGDEKLILLSDVKYVLEEYLGDNNIKKEEYLNMVDVLHQENDYIVDKFVKGFSLDDDYTSSTDYENALEYCVKELKKLISKYFDIIEENKSMFNKISDTIEEEAKKKEFKLFDTYFHGLCVAKKIVEEVEEQYKEEFEK